VAGVGGGATRQGSQATAEQKEKASRRSAEDQREPYRDAIGRLLNGARREKELNVFRVHFRTGPPLGEESFLRRLGSLGVRALNPFRRSAMKAAKPGMRFLQYLLLDE
jgi:hypothetical protein